MRLDWRERPLRAALLAGGLAGLLLGLAGGGAEAPSPDVSEAPWSLPGPARLQRASAEDVAVLQQSPAWQGDARARTAGAGKAVTWKLLGIVSQDGGHALVQVEGAREVLRLAAGARLPDGASLVAVEANRIVIEKAGCRSTLRLYSSARAGEVPACDNPAPSPASPPGTP